MKIVWIVLAAAVLLSPAAASSAGFDDDCPAPTSQSSECRRRFICKYLAIVHVLNSMPIILC